MAGLINQGGAPTTLPWAAQGRELMTSGDQGQFTNLMKAFGPPKQNYVPSLLDNQLFTHYDLPEAFKGTNMYLTTRLAGFIIDSNEWFTTVCLPWIETDQHHVEMNTWTFNATLADRVPHEGVSRLVSSKKGRSAAQILRRGLACIMEGDFYNTREGMDHFQRNLIGIGQAVQETVNHDVVHTIMSCKNGEKKWQDEYGTLRYDHHKMMNEEIANYACVIRDQSRLDIQIESFRRLLTQKKIIPNMLIMPPGMILYLKMAPPRATEYWGMSPDAELEYKRGPFSEGEYRGIDVFETRDFPTLDNGVPVQLLTRRVQIGERYEMFGSQFRTMKNFQRCGGYNSCWRDIYIYNENVDDWQKIHFEDALRNAMLFNCDGDGEIDSRVYDYAKDLRKRHESGRSLKHKHHPEPYAKASNPFVLITHDANNEPCVAEYFGCLDSANASINDFMQVAESIIQHLGDSHNHQMLRRDWHDGMKLISEIESQPYVEQYFRDLIDENLPQSVSPDGRFIGDPTPIDLCAKWRLPEIIEWAPNQWGSLDLPYRDGITENSAAWEHRKSIKFPAGFANGPGITTLAQEAHNESSHWHEAGKRAYGLLNAIESIVHALRSTCRGSEAINADNRSPWFHKEDAVATFFSMIVSVNRDPIFLATPARPAAGTGRHHAKDKLHHGREVETFEWNLVPLLSAGVNLENATEVRAAVKHLIYNQPYPSTASHPGETAFVYQAPDGTSVIITLDDLKRTNYALSKEVMALSMMGQNSFEALRKILLKLQSIPSTTGKMSLRNKLVHFIMHTAGSGKKASTKHVNNVQRVRAVIRLLAEQAEGEGNKLEENIDRLYEAVTKQSMAPVQDLIKAATQKFRDEDEDIVRADTILDIEPREPLVSEEDAEQARDRFQAILDLTWRANQIRATQNPPLPPIVPRMTDGAWLTAARNDLRDNEYQEILTALESGPIAQRDLAGTNAPFMATRASSPAAEAAASAVPDLRGPYYRCPLTMSKTLLRRIAQLGNNHSLIRPSNPATAHTTVFDLDAGVDVPLEYLTRIEMEDIEFIERNPGKRAFKDTNVIRRLRMGDLSMADTLHSHSGRRSRHHNKKTRRNRQPRNAPVMFADDDDMSSSSSSSSDEESGRPLPMDSHEMRRHDIECEERYNKLHTESFLGRWREGHEESNPLLRAACIAFMLTPINWHQIKLMLDNNVHIPIGIILWRLNIEHLMSSAVLMKSGLDTGASLYGHTNFAVGQDVATKVIYCNFTFNAKCMVWKPENVIIMQNLRPEGYLGGNNCNFITDPKELDIEELSVDPDRASLIATAVPITEPKLDKELSFTGELPFNDLVRNGDGKLQYSSARYYDSIYNLSTKVSRSAPQLDNYFEEADRYNVIAYQGHQFSFNPVSAHYDKITQCAGHRGVNGSYPGAAAIWSGKILFLNPNVDFSSFKLT